MEKFEVIGLQKLRYLDLHGHNLDFPLTRISLPDAFSLRELHIGGNSIANDDILPSSFLHQYTSLTLLNISSAHLLGIERDAFLFMQNLSVLDLSYNQLDANSLANVTLSITNLKHLNLSHNHLTSLPATFRDQLDNMSDLHLFLSGNMFYCNCENLEFLKWIQSNSGSILFHTADELLCSDSPGNTVYDFNYSLHCNSDWMQPVLTVAGTFGVVFLCLAGYMVYRKRWVLANLAFRLREWLSRMKRGKGNDHTVSYTYDAYVLYTSMDEDRLWVHYKLVPQLEKVYGFRLCIHHRDFLGGADIVDNIEAAILRSRKVLVIMSPHFLTSKWCREEVHMTNSVDPKKFVVVMYQDVLMSGVPIPLVIRRLLERKTYIEWHEEEQAQPLFWKKVRKALYSQHMTYSESERPDVLELMPLNEI